MRRAAALILVIAAMAWARKLGPIISSNSTGAAFAVGFTLLGAWLAGDLLRRLQLPRLTGYLLFGALAYRGNVITAEMVGQLQFVTGLATTLIALIAGLTLNFDRLGRQIRAILQITGSLLGFSVLGLSATLWLAWPWLPIAPDAEGLSRLVMVGLTAIIAVTFSPTMAAAVTTETGARGRLGELVLPVIVLADLALILLFTLAMQGARAVLVPGGADGVGTLVRFAWELGGAVAFGSLVGALFALYLRYVGREVTLVLIGVCMLLSQVGSRQQFEPLLAAVAAGVLIENLSIAQGDALKTAVQRGATPVLVIFFVAIGSSLQLDALATVGFLALGLSAARLLFLRLGVSVGTAIAGSDPVTSRYLWTGLISQAGITLGFASVVASEFPGWGNNLQLLVVALIAIHELPGPLLFRYGLTRSGGIAPSEPRPLIVVSNREPYLHHQTPAGDLVVSHATGGVAVALDALMRERGGVWVAHGAGDADRLVVDERNRVRVPPDHPSYELRRLWLEEPTFSNYYNGFANEGLWPLCHLVDVRPQFRHEDWHAYQEINQRFAAAVDEEVAVTGGAVFIQDYHLALVAPALRARRPTARTALFWHIPWPYPDRLRICPWAHELLAGLLANDLLAFQLDRDRRNFLLAVEEELGAEVEEEASRVRFGNRVTTVVSVPIGVDYDRIQSLAADRALRQEQDRLRELFGLTAQFIGIGVDRLDYTKGIPERLAALDEVMRRRPELRGRLTFVQIGVPSRSELDSYSAIEQEIDRRVQELNVRHALPGAPPLVRYHKRPLTISSLVALYRLAQFCIVSSLHDGMNLVAKEFVAARDDDDGVLVLSGLAGAAQELKDALIINPYDVAGFADALVAAIDMPIDERRARMRAMRRIVAGRNVFGWASDILDGLESLWTKPLHYSVRRWEEMSV